MPYIDQDSRRQIDRHNRPPLTVGELNYVITCHILRDDLDLIAKNVFTYWHFWNKNQSYQLINDIIGVLECAKLEYCRRKKGDIRDYVLKAIDDVKADFYNQIAAPYEQKKMEINGDVYGG